MMTRVAYIITNDTPHQLLFKNHDYWTKAGIIRWKGRELAFFLSFFHSYRIRRFRFGRRRRIDYIGFGIGVVVERSTEGLKLVPMVTTREDATEAEYDDQEESCPERET